MSYYRYKRLQQYINGQPTEVYKKGDRADDVDYSTYDACMGGTADTRWVSIPQTVCYDGDLYSMEKEQISYDGISWSDTGNSRRASVIEQSSAQCFMNDWRVVPGEFICMMHAKWTKEAEYVSYDGGQTWTATGNIRRGETVIELLSADCGVIYQWIPTGEYICQGYNKYMKEKQVYSTDNGSTWTDTGNRRTGGLVEADSPYCGYEQYIYQWVDVAGEYVCQGTTKYKKQKEQRSSDNGQTWEDTGNTRAGSVIETSSEDCGYVYLLARRHYSDGTTRDIPGRGKLTSKIYGESYVSGVVVADILEGTTIIDTGALAGNCYASNYPNYEYIYFYSENLTEIWGDIYFECPDIQSVPLKYMGPVERAVDGKIIIPGNVKTVGGGIANGLLYITEVIFDDGVERIGRLNSYNSGSDCVTTVRLPSTLASLSSELFRDLHGLTTVNNFPNDVTDLPVGLFRGCTSFTSFTIPSTVTSIGQYAFADSGITSITVPDSVQTIGRYAFYKCESLETVTLGDGLTSIEAYTFGGCTSLKTLTVGESVTTIDGHWLELESGSQNHPLLESIIFRSSTPPSFVNLSSAGAWWTAPKARIYVPCESIQAYRQAYANVAIRIEGYNCNQSTDYLTLQALEAGTISLTGMRAATTNLRYSKNGGAWTNIAIDEVVSVETDDIIRWRGNLQSNPNSASRSFTTTCRFNVSGNPLSLVYNNFGNETDISHITGCMRSLFEGSMVVDASGLRLPATTLAQSCYTRMFYGCTYLTAAPVLPATTTAFYCYQQMFALCTNLTTAPALPATTITDQCYYKMFRNCTSLTTAPALPATALARYAYQEMFYGCSNLNYIKAMFTSTPNSYTTSDWVYGVASEGTFVKNSAATWNVVGSTGVPSGWTIETAS